MINSEVPSNTTFSPSDGTPQLTINRDATIDLDSSNAFEGPEKLLEVWFAPDADALPATAADNGLKCVPAEAWKEMLDLVNCKVLSTIESEHVDAYLLSESSMFVFHHKLILKTCGTTTLLWGLPRMLDIAAKFAGFPHQSVSSLKGMATAATPYRIFYSRKNFLFPDRQHGPHRSWNDEVRYLDRMFWGGSAYMVGKMNGDHWYLYLTTPNTALTPPATPPHDDDDVSTETKILNLPGGSGLSPHTAASGKAGNDDETLEILMTDLEPENAKQFYLENASAVAEGRYMQKARETRHQAAESLGHLTKAGADDDVNEHCKAGGKNTQAADSFDVFGNTPTGNTLPDESDDGDNDNLSYPEELTTEGHALGTVVSQACGLSDLYPVARYPDARVDAYLFTPCGFSANGVIPAPADDGNGDNGDDGDSDGKDGATAAATPATHYFTVHVTPEPQCSYASFETNVPGRLRGRATSEVIEQVVEIFKPGRFSVTLFEAKAGSSSGDGDGDMGGMGGGHESAGTATLATTQDEDAASSMSSSTGSLVGGNTANGGSKAGGGAVVAAGTAAKKEKRSSGDGESSKRRSARMENLKGYRRVDRIVHDFDGYDLVFRYYERNDWAGGAPRLGEMVC